MMSESLAPLLQRMPGVFWSSRLNPVTGGNEWLYFSPKMPEMYGVSIEEMRRDPNTLMARILPEDRARLEAAMGESIQTLAPMNWTGRVEHAPGQIRWIESQTNITREEDGTYVWCGQVLDVTERKKAELALAESEAARARSDSLYRAVIDALPLGVVVMDSSGRFLVYNPAQEKLSGSLRQDHDGDLTRAYGIFKTDGATPFPNEELPVVRALHGEENPEAELLFRNPTLEGEVRLHATGRQIRDASGQVIAAMALSQDVTAQRALEAELRTRNQQLAASEEAKTALIERLRLAIDELSNPILEVWDGVLAMPIIGVVDSRRTADMVQRLLAEVTRTQASFVIVDLTGVEVVDTKTADHLLKLMRKVEVVGARAVITGIRPAVAETLVDIGVDLGRAATFRNLKHGLREALRAARREREGSRDEDLILDDGAAEASQPRRRAR
jgi:rsbT co-antagonist protein RsbR